MAGADHLERMGRELKCPICLNLLHSAASLSCNHVFCHSCITKSMQSSSSCPVCKVPFHRRDIRPSPHMDSLVAIYKNMKADAGIHCITSEIPLAKQEAPEIRSQGENLAESAGLELLSTVPSFPSKKRVHVAPYSVAEVSPVKDKGEPLFSPFFWMREDVDEDVDMVSQKSTPQRTPESPSPLVPCFSDIKDENDVSSTRNTPTSKSRVGEIVDSEMFEWTQRPCSPELWLTPTMDQIKETSQSEEFRKEEEADESADKRFPGSTSRGKRRLIWKRCRMINKGASLRKRKPVDSSHDNPETGRKKKQKMMLCSSGEIIAEKLPVAKCAFCQSSEETQVSGEMVRYLHGKPVPLDFIGSGRIIHSHELCAEWAPNVYFEGGEAVNLAAEVARSRRIKCSHCGVNGAALGCLEKTCRRSFHYTCAQLLSGCRWDQEKFIMSCPLHASSQLSLEPKSTHKRVIRTSRQAWRWSTGSSPKWVLCCSSLSTPEKEAVLELVKLAGVSLSKNWSPAVTHVIAAVNDKGACKRTLKFLMGIAGGKWILNMRWVNACLKRREPVAEAPYEIKEDAHGILDGPRIGRLRSLRQEPKLFKGFEFYFAGEFSASQRGLLQDLVTAAGGAVLRRKPVSEQEEALSPGLVYIVYDLEDGGASSAPAEVVERRRVKAAALAEATGGRVATDRWIMDSIAGCKIQSLA